MGWLDLLLKSTEESEAPERYFWWSGMAAISAVVRKNVWLDRHYYKLYPNIYVALVSARSGAAKGIPISICKKILEATDSVRIISGCNSIQGLIQELGTQKTLKGGAVINEAHGILLSDEFDSFLTDDPKSLTYLTALHNTHEHETSWEKILKNSPKQELKSPCITLLVASNESLFDSVVKRKDIEGGFIGRTFVVYETKPRLINSLVYAPKNKLDIGRLKVRLMEISNIKGEFQWKESSGKFFDAWYDRLRKRSDIDDRTGSINRLGDQVLKATMLISLSKRDSLEIEEEDLYTAIERCQACVNTAIKITPVAGGVNGAEKPNSMRLITKFLEDAPNYTLSKAVMVSRLHPHGIHSSELNSKMVELTEVGWVRMFKDADGKIQYKLTDEGYKNLVGGNFVN